MRVPKWARLRGWRGALVPVGRPVLTEIRVAPRHTEPSTSLGGPRVGRRKWLGGGQWLCNQRWARLAEATAWGWGLK